MAQVFVIDPDIVVRIVLRRILERAGYDVVEASSGEEARDSLSSGQAPDLVVADLDTPGMAGFEEAGGLPLQPGTRVIATYSGNDTADAEEYPALARSVGADCTLAKPFSSGVFLQRLTALLDEAHNLPGAIAIGGRRGVLTGNAPLTNPRAEADPPDSVLPAEIPHHS